MLMQHDINNQGQFDVTCESTIRYVLPWHCGSRTHALHSWHVLGYDMLVPVNKLPW